METLKNTWNSFLDYLPTLLLAVGWLLVGTVVALVVAAIVRYLLKLTTLDDRMAKWLTGHGEDPKQKSKVESVIAQIVFWVLEIFVVVAFFDRLQLEAISGPLQGMLDQALVFLPKVFAALLIAVLAFLLAKVLKLAVTKAMHAMGADEKVRKHLTGTGSQTTTPATTPSTAASTSSQASLTKSVGNAVFGIVLLLALPLILGVLELDGLLEPVQSMIFEALAFLPNLLLAALILVVGYVAAKLLRQVLTNLLESVGADRLTQSLTESSPTGGLKASKILGTLAFVLVLIPVVIAALNALQVESLTRPAENMLQSVLQAIPNIFAAVALVVLAYFVGKFLKQMVVSLLSSLGFDHLLGKLGGTAATQAMPAEGNLSQDSDSPATMPAESTSPASSKSSPSEVAGTVVLVAVMLIAVQEALELLGFARLGALVQELLGFLASVVLGAIIIGVGVYLANLAAKLIRNTGTPNAELMAKFARYGIIVVAVFMGLSEAGVGETIVRAAFIAAMAGAALAAGLAFGLGGREAAKARLEKLESGSAPPSQP